jgi:hypothetical protein
LFVNRFFNDHLYTHNILLLFILKPFNQPGNLIHLVRLIPLDLLISAKPGELTFGKSSGVALECSNALIPRQYFVEKFNHMAVADGLH